MKRLIVVADNSLIVGAIRTGVRESDAFQLLGYIDLRNASARMIANAGADVVLVDEADYSEQAVTLIRGIKEESDDITVIVLTVRMGGEWLERALEAGASGAISKAVHPLALTTLVREVLSGHIVHPFASVNTRNETSRAVTAQHSSLTERELEILQLVTSGATNSEIARRLWITQQTVKFHVSNIYRKLDVNNRTEACHYAHVNGLVALREALPIGLIPSSERSRPASPERAPLHGQESGSVVGESRLDAHAHAAAG
jgi:DNA-binding NarL/FixJ family response regulator